MGLGPRSKDDSANIEGSGYNYRDRVHVTHLNRDAEGIIEAVHAGGKKVDVRIDEQGHRGHGSIATFDVNEIEPHEDLLKAVGGKAKAVSAKD